MKSLEDSIYNLSNIDISTPSDVEIALDRLAASLMTKFKISQKRFWGRAPSLLEILKLIQRQKPSLSEAIPLLREIESIIKRAYDDELDEEEADDLSANVTALQDLLESELIK